MRENKFKAELIKVLEPLFRVYRIENKLELGMPDLLVSRSSYEKPHLWIETKTDKDWLNKNQEQWIKNTEDERVLVARLIRERIFIYKRLYDPPYEWEIIYEDAWPDCDKKGLREFIMEQ